MIAVLLGLPSKVKTLLDRMTSVRSANLDNLNATVSSRAAAATAMSNAVWPDALATRLAASALEASPLISPPIVSGVIPQAPTFVTLSSYTVMFTQNSGLEHLGVTSTSYVNAVDYTGKGVLEFAAAQCETAAKTATMQITVDGVVIILATVAGAAAGNVAAMVGVVNSSGGISLSAIPFKVSLKIEIKVTSGGTARSFIKYRKTA